MQDDDRVRIAVGHGRVEVEGPRAFVLEQIARLMPRVGLRSAGEVESSAQPTGRRSAKAIREFLRSKELKNRYEEIAAVLSYAETFDDRAELSVGEIMSYLEAAGLDLPKAPSQAVADAKRWKGYVVSPRRGAWRLTAAGRQVIDGKEKRQ